MKQHDLTVHMVPVGQLQTHPANANNGDVDVIEESIAVNGVYRPICAQRSTGYVLVGNHTFLGQLRQGALAVATIWLDVDDTDAKRIMVADNQTARRGQDDEAQLYNLLDELRATDEGLAGTGFEYRDLEYLEQLMSEPLTAEDLGVDVEKDDPEDVRSGDRGRRLGFTVTPETNEAGECEQIVLTRPNFGRVTAVDFNALMIALGHEPLTRTELAQQGVPDWENR